jgi:N-acetylneuraminic acid mutarotase
MPHVPAGLKPQELQAWLAMAQRGAGNHKLDVTFPNYYSAGTQVRSLGMSVALKPLHSSAAPAQVEDGKLVYHNAYPATDTLQVVTSGRSEEFLLLHDSSAPLQFDYDISAMSGVKDVSLQSGSIRFANAQGQQMQIEAPYLVDSTGQSVANAVHWELSYPNGPAQPHLALVVANAAQLQYPVMIDPTWIVTPSALNVPRFDTTATLLNNGQVLIAGGYPAGSGFGTTSAELYNPATGLWTLTGSMQVARVGHTATLLPDGNVLVAGGAELPGNSSNSAEIYHVASGTWTETGNLVAKRYSHSATLLPNGMVLVAGGFDIAANMEIASAEIYNPATGDWTATGSLLTPLYSPSATLLANGKVLLTGGFGLASGPLSLVQIYDPTAGSWSQLGSLSTVRYDATATLLPGGLVLVSGGEGSSGILNTAELYNPATGATTPTANMNEPRAGSSAILLNNGQVLVVGGDTYNTSEVYDPVAGTWTITGTTGGYSLGNTATVLLPSGQVLVVSAYSGDLYDSAGGSFSATGNLLGMREEHTATLLPNGLVLVEGGQGSPGNPLATAELYNPATGMWAATGSLHVARFAQTATLLPSGLVLVAGGYNFTTGALASAELYDPSTGAWTTTGDMTAPHILPTATLLPSGLVLVAGGGTNSNVQATAELYNPANGMWTATGSLHTARGGNTATLLSNGQVLVAGGQDINGNLLTSAELYDPTAGTWAATGDLHTARNLHTATLIPVDTNEAWVLVAGGTSTTSGSAEFYEPDAGIWMQTGNLNTVRSLHTATLLPNGHLLVTGGGDATGNPLASAEVFDAYSGTWAPVGDLATARYRQTATLLPSGKVLVAGGGNNSGSLNSSELYDPDYGAFPGPQLNAISAVNALASLSLTGSNFTGITGLSVPTVQLESLVNEQVLTISPATSGGYTATSFNSLPPTGLVPGYALLTVFAAGVPSTAQIVSYTTSALPQTIANFPNSANQSLEVSGIGLRANTIQGLPVTYSVVSGPASLIYGTDLELNSVGTVVVQATQAGNSLYQPYSETETFHIVPEMDFSNWEQQPGYFTATQANTSGVGGWTDTPQNDGVANGLKFLCGINPAISMTGADRAALPTVVLDSTTDPGITLLAVTYRQSALVQPLTPTLEESTDLQTWYPQISAIDQQIGVDPVTRDPIMEMGVVVPINNSRPMFIRLQVTGP